jgi:type VI protein secretion system component Hcp
MKSNSKSKSTKAASKMKDLPPKANPKGGKTSMNDMHFTKVVDKSSPTF